MFIDDVTIELTAGHGGKGAVAFNRNLLQFGPAGADGGKGGDVYFEGVSDLTVLTSFRQRHTVKAEDGEIGKPQFNDGADAPDLVLRLPVGTVIHNLDTGTSIEMTQIGERILAARGGKGGYGNYKYRSSTNQSPKEFHPGFPGEVFNFRFELKLIADVGLIGLPNAGKSSLLNQLTSAKAKVANYAFTTLEPNLGAYYDLIIADIPGLIEGASEGKGLGVQFLRHIERTKVLFHLVSAESSDVVADYEVVRNELTRHNPELAAKREYVFVSKADNADPAEVETKLAELRAKGLQPFALSIIDEESIKRVQSILNAIADDKRVS